MNVDGFLRDCRLEWPTFDNRECLAAAPHPRDRRLARLPAQIDGYATENKLMLLNLAARHLERGEVYVEVGCWKGLTLAGAAQGNPDVPLYACDDFSRMGASRDLLRDAVENHTANGQLRFYDQDFRRFLAQAPWQPARVGTYFYDGGHSFHFQFQALELIRPHLADDALVIIDDTNDLPVRRANALFLLHNPQFQLIRDVRVKEYQDPAWWNGIQLIRYRANPGAAAEPVPASRYLAERMLWNRAVFYAQRGSRLATNGHRAVRRTLGRMLAGRGAMRTDP
ncbi:MAG: class I SAM-dependent methyltransferase [Longimicrobiales bacterium]